jgi:protein TonB
MRPMDYTPAPERAEPSFAVPIPTPPPKTPLPQPVTKVHVQQPHPLSPPVLPHKDVVVTKETTPVSTTAVLTQVVDPNPRPPLPPVSMQPIETSLTATAAPAPTYPRDALRDGITGTVELELLVGVDGRVLGVTITHSSGNHLLDEAAREQVLRNWRFQPALRDGIPVQSLGRVPIVFDLDGR